MVKGLHDVVFDPTKSKSRRRHIDLATALNRAINQDDLSRDIPLKEVSKMVEHIINDNKGAMSFLEANKSGHITRNMLRRFKRKLNFTGSMEEWNEGRKEEEASKPKPFFDASQADVSYNTERDPWGVVISKKPVGVRKAYANASRNANTSATTATGGASDPWGATNSNGGANTGATDPWGVGASSNAGASGWGEPVPVVAVSDPWGAPNNGSDNTTQAADAWGGGASTSNNAVSAGASDPWGGANDYSNNHMQAASILDNAGAVANSNAWGETNDLSNSHTQTTDTWGNNASTSNNAGITTVSDPWGGATNPSDNNVQATDPWGDGVVSTSNDAGAAASSDPWGGANYHSDNNPQVSHAWGGGVSTSNDTSAATDGVACLDGNASITKFEVSGWGGAAAGDAENGEIFFNFAFI